jgi:hypothetical protein
VSVEIHDHTVVFEQEATRNASLGLRMLAEAIVAKSEPNTPKKRGNLRRDVLKQVLGLHGEIRWQKRYAEIQETRQAKHYTTPGTGPHFAENAVRDVSAHSDDFFRRAGLI